MILRNDESHLQAALLAAIAGERISGTEAARQMIIWLREGRFDAKGYAKDQRWFFEQLKIWPYEPQIEKNNFLFNIDETAIVKLGIYTCKVKIIARWKKGDIVTNNECPYVTRPIKLDANAYLLQDLSDETDILLEYENKLLKMTDRKSAK
jgi:hypothetical protein